MSIPTHMDPHVEPSAGKFDPDKLEVAPGRTRESVEGWIPELATEEELRGALEKALPKDSTSRQKIAYSDIAALVFSGRDPAAGKSWEAWVKKYWEKKASGGQGGSLHPDALE